MGLGPLIRRSPCLRDPARLGRPTALAPHKNIKTDPTGGTIISRRAPPAHNYIKTDPVRLVKHKLCDMHVEMGHLIELLRENDAVGFRAQCTLFPQFMSARTTWFHSVMHLAARLGRTDGQTSGYAQRALKTKSQNAAGRSATGDRRSTNVRRKRGWTQRRALLWSKRQSATSERL